MRRRKCEILLTLSYLTLYHLEYGVPRLHCLRVYDWCGMDKNSAFQRVVRGRSPRGRGRNLDFFSVIKI